MGEMWAPRSSVLLMKVDHEEKLYQTKTHSKTWCEQRGGMGRGREKPVGSVRPAPPPYPARAGDAAAEVPR